MRSAVWSSSFRRKQPGIHQHLPRRDAVGRVNVQYPDRCTARRGFAQQSRARPSEVAMPRLTSWIEERNHATRSKINTAQVARFREIAIMAGPGEVGYRVASPDASLE